jgi:hypothetical protein
MSSAWRTARSAVSWAARATGRFSSEAHRRCITADDFVFVADCGNNRVQVLMPSLDFHGLVGVSQLSNPVGVCANPDVVVVAEASPAHRVAVFRRSDDALLRRFASHGSGDGQLKYPHGLCFACGGRHVAVVDWDNDCVSVFSVDGEFIHHVGVGVLTFPLAWRALPSTSSSSLTQATTTLLCSVLGESC